MAVMTYREALNLALREEMRRDPRVFVMGEEVGLYEGAYKVTQGLLKEFGEKRIIDTPICESGFTGVGVGAAMLGLRPVIEMMTFNFSILALDQIVNSAAKLCYMSGGQYNIPLVVRGPGGPASQLAAQHSQSMEAYFYHVPGLKVVRPSTPADAKGLLKSAIRDDNPVIFIESETLYAIKGEVPEDPDFLIPLGQAAIRREGTDVTVVAYMGMLYRALEVAEELAKDGISIEIVDPRTLRPMDTDTHRGLGAQDPPLRRDRGGRGLRRHGLGDRRRPPGRGLRRPRRAGRPHHRRERAHALRAQPRAAQDPVQGQDRRGHPKGLRMITKVIMPKLSEAMETGKVIKWLKKEGDAIKGGDVIAEIETDKANVEIEAFGGGVLRKIVVQRGRAGARGRPDRRHRRCRGRHRRRRHRRSLRPAPPSAARPRRPAGPLPAMESYRSAPATAPCVPDGGRARSVAAPQTAGSRPRRSPARSPPSPASICG